jgi:transposase
MNSLTSGSLDTSCFLFSLSVTAINTVCASFFQSFKAVLQKFCELLTPEQRTSIKVVTGDGARWITDCVKEYFPNAKRCVDPFHVVELATETLDKVRIAAWRRAQEVVNALAVNRGKGRPHKDDKQAQLATDAKKKADQIKKSMY